MAANIAEKLNGSLRPLILAGYFFAAAVSGAGGSFLWLKQIGPDIVRPDPFTGTQASALAARITSLEYHVRNHPDETGKFDSRIARLEAQNDLIITQLERLLNQMELK